MNNAYGLCFQIMSKHLLRMQQVIITNYYKGVFLQYFNQCN